MRRAAAGLRTPTSETRRSPHRARGKRGVRGDCHREARSHRTTGAGNRPGLSRVVGGVHSTGRHGMLPRLSRGPCHEARRCYALAARLRRAALAGAPSASPMIASSAFALLTCRSRAIRPSRASWLGGSTTWIAFGFVPAIATTGPGTSSHGASSSQRVPRASAIAAATVPWCDSRGTPSPVCCAAYLTRISPPSEIRSNPLVSRPFRAQPPRLWLQMSRVREPLAPTDSTRGELRFAATRHRALPGPGSSRTQ